LTKAPASVTPQEPNHPQTLILLLNVVARWRKRHVLIFFLTVLHKCNARRCMAVIEGPARAV
jgi:hypothetical protein